RLNKTAPQLNAVLQNIGHFVVIVEQTMTVQPIKILSFKGAGGGFKTVCAHYFQIAFIPQDQMQIIIIVAVSVAAFSAAFANRAKSDFTQAAQFAQDWRILLAVTLP